MTPNCRPGSRRGGGRLSWRRNRKEPFGARVRSLNFGVRVVCRRLRRFCGTYGAQLRRLLPHWKVTQKTRPDFLWVGFLRRVALSRLLRRAACSLSDTTLDYPAPGRREEGGGGGGRHRLSFFVDSEKTVPPVLRTHVRTPVPRIV